MKIRLALLLGCSLVSQQFTDAENGDESARPMRPASTKDRSSALRKRNPYSYRRTRSSLKTTRVLVEFANDAGRDYAIQLSKRVYHHSQSRNFVAIEIETSRVPELESRGDIDAVHSDGLFYEQGYLEEEVSLDEHNGRFLFQTTPYGIIMVQADQVDVGQSPVRVCIPDTGALTKHPDLPEKLMRGSNRYSSISGEELRWRRDVRGHGSHTAGTVSASDNGFGVRGIGQIPLYITRPLNDLGQARESDIIEAVEQCRNSGAKVISLSLGGGGMSSTLSNLLTSLYNEGFLIVAASGNNGQNVQMFPAAHPLVMAIGAVQSDRSIWPNSNYGSWLELSAPGKSIYSTTVNSVGQSVYAYYSGTSMATPHVAGVAALVWSHFPTCTNTQIRYALLSSAKDSGASGCDQYFGYGIVQAKAAMEWLLNNPCEGATYGMGTINGGCTVLQTLSS